jgi:hypothetical protein
MRSIQVSTDVFAAIWRDRRDGEDSEDSILRRRFDLDQEPEPAALDGPIGPIGTGFYDARYDATWDEGEEIFRVYKGTEFRAQARGRKWLLLNTGKTYPTLNALSKATAGHENAWNGWFYIDGNRRRSIAHKRNPSKVIRRIVTDEDLIA